MKLTEDLLSSIPELSAHEQPYTFPTDLVDPLHHIEMVQHVVGSYKVTLPQFDHSDTSVSSPPADPVIIDFSPPFQRISFVSKLNELLNGELPMEQINSYGMLRLLFQSWICAWQFMDIDF